MKYLLSLLIMIIAVNASANSAYYNLEQVKIIKPGNENLDYRVKLNNGCILDVDEEELFFSSKESHLVIQSFFSPKPVYAFSAGQSIYYRAHYRSRIHKTTVLAVNSHKGKFLAELNSSILDLDYDNHNIYNALVNPELKFLKSGKSLIEVKIVGRGIKKNDSAKFLLIESIDGSLNEVKYSNFYIKECLNELCPGDEVIKIGKSKINTVIALSIDGNKAFLDNGATVSPRTSAVHIHKKGALSLERIELGLVKDEVFTYCIERQFGNEIASYIQWYGNRDNRYDIEISICNNDIDIMLNEYKKLDSKEAKEEFVEAYKLK